MHLEVCFGFDLGVLVFHLFKYNQFLAVTLMSGSHCSILGESLLFHFAKNIFWEIFAQMPVAALWIQKSSLIQSHTCILP